MAQRSSLRFCRRHVIHLPGPWLLLVGLSLATGLGTAAGVDGARVIVAPLPGSTTSQTKIDPSARELKLGEPIEREMIGDEIHVYQIALVAGQFTHIVVDQRTMDLAVTQFGPDGLQVGEFDGRDGGQEPVSVLASTSGWYRLQVRSRLKSTAPTRYLIKVEALRAATAEDESWIVAERASTEGKHLMEQGTAESFRKAIEKNKEARSLWQRLRDAYGQAEALNYLAIAFCPWGRTHGLSRPLARRSPFCKPSATVPAKPLCLRTWLPFTPEWVRSAGRSNTTNWCFRSDAMREIRKAKAPR